MNEIRDYQKLNEKVLLIRDWQDIGKTLREIRYDKHMKISQFARFCDMSPAMVSNIENGLNYPNMQFFMKIAAKLGFTRIVIETIPDRIPEPEYLSKGYHDGSMYRRC